MDNVQISLTAARYILQVTRDLISRLHGSEYDPSNGVFSEVNFEHPSMYTRQEPDPELHSWLSTCTIILKLVASILAQQVMLDQENQDPEELSAVDTLNSLDFPRL